MNHHERYEGLFSTHDRLPRLMYIAEHQAIKTELLLFDCYKEE